MANYATSALKLTDTYVNTLPYNTCSTAAEIPAKTVSAGDFALETGAMVVVKFTKTNTATSPTLNVSSTGAKAIYYKGAAVSASQLVANKVYQFVYNGTQWDLLSGVDSSLHYVPSTAFTVTAGSSTSGSYLAAKWSVANVDGITTPEDGMCVMLRTPSAGYSGGIVLSIDGATTYYPIVRNVNTLVTTNYGSGSSIILVFNKTQVAAPYLTAGITTPVTGCWQIADYDSNSTYSNASLGQGYATCSTAATTVAKTASLSSYSATTGGIVSVKFTKGISVASPTLNINSKGAKAIYYRGAALTDTTLIEANDLVTFIYSTQYHIISIVKAQDLTPERALVTDSNGKIVTSEVSSTEINYLSGITSNVQTQIDAVNWYAAGNHTHTTDDLDGGTQTWVFNCGTSTTVM